MLGLDAAGLRVATADAAITVAEVQAPGRKRMAAAAFHVGRPLSGVTLG